MKRILNLILCGMMLSLCVCADIPQETAVETLIPQTVQQKA